MRTVLGSIACLFVAVSGLTADQAPLPAHTVHGDLNARARLQAIHAEMQHECGASPGSLRCKQLKREFHEQARHVSRQHHR